MTGSWLEAPRRRVVILQAIGVTATLTVFAIDIALPHGYDISYLYAVTVLVAAYSRRPKVVMRTAIGAVGLTFAAFALKEHENWHGITTPEIFSRVMAAVVIALIAFIAIAETQRELKNRELGKALRAAEGGREIDRRMLAAASTISPIGTWSVTVDDDHMDMSDEAAVLHGIPAGDRPLRSDVLSHMDPADAQRLRDRVTRAWEDGTPIREEVRINNPDGTHRWIVTMGERTQLDDDSAARVHGTVQDITLWKEAELAASAQGNRFSQLTQSLPIIVWTADREGHVDYFNDALSRYTGLTDEELQNDGWVATVEPSDLDEVLASWNEALAAGSNLDIEYRIRGADGVYRWHHVNAQPERDADGEIVRWWGSTINVDAARRLREEADTLAAEREIVLESVSEGVYALDHESRFVYVNASALRILGLHEDREQLRGQVLWEAFPKLVGTVFETFLKGTVSRGEPAQLTYKATLADKWLETAATPTSTGVTVSFRDVTEVQRLSEQLAQSQRLESIGQLTGGIAHDFNNLLTVVLGGADALTADETLTDDSREMAELIGSAAERGAELTHRLLAFARRQPLEPQSVDLAERLSKFEPLLRRTLGEDIDIVVAPDGAVAAEVDPGQFENALLNLAINARDAMPSGGTLTIEVNTTTLDDSYVTTHADVAPGTYVVVTVSDTGIGIDPDNLGKLFDPFFTTKTMGQGSGLGLAMVWGFVKQSGGHVTVYSELGLGTSFKMFLPVAPTTPLPTPPISEQIHTGPLTGTILLAEDDDLVRVFATDRLRAKGYEVVATASGPEALAALESMDRLDILFTDVIMPGGMTGRQLADAVLERRPGTPVLYASGYTENVILHNGRLDPGVKLLAKPYSTKQLIERIGDLLATAAEDRS
ncbi:MAG: PAS domain S-box protein [Demequinaceae bacterium]|nr:PAS domain S-box protein [Demequinaceae bacterium]